MVNCGKMLINCLYSCIAILHFMMVLVDDFIFLQIVSLLVCRFGFEITFSDKKDHRNGIKKCKKHRFVSMKGVSQLLIYTVCNYFFIY